MDGPRPAARLEPAMAWCGRAAVLVVLVVSVLTWVGWAARIEALTRIYPSWPPMTPWITLWLAALGAAILAQSGRPSRARVWVGRG